MATIECLSEENKAWEGEDECNKRCNFDKIGIDAQVELGSNNDSKETETSQSSSSMNSRSQPKKDKTRPGRKVQWIDESTDDLVDIICNNETYKRRIIFTNVKKSKNGGYYKKIVKELKETCTRRGENFNYSINQTREKFKHLVAECKKVALVMKTSSGIKRFQDNKGYSL